MRTTVDIPDATYRLLKSKAAAEGGTVKQLVLRGVESVLNPLSARPVDKPEEKAAPRLKAPLIPGKPGTLNLTNEMIDDLLHSA